MLTFLTGFIVRTYFVRTLGGEYLGINGLFSNILTMLSLADLGIGSAIVFRLYKPIATHDDKMVRIYMKFYKLAYKVIGLFVLALGLLMIPLLPVLIKDYSRLADLNINATLLFLLFLSQTVASYLFLAYRQTVITSNQKQHIIDVVTIIVSLAADVLRILVLVLFKNFIIYTVVGVTSTIAIGLINGVIAKKLYPQYFIKEIDSLSRQEVREMFKDCGALFLYKANNVVAKSCDNMVISSFIGLNAVGLYSNYMLLYRTTLALYSKLSNGFKASMGNLYATGSLETKYRFFKIVNFMSAVVLGTAAAVTAVCGNEIITVWLGKKFALDQLLAILIGIEFFLAGINITLGNVRTITGVFRQAWYRPVIAIIVNIVVSVGLVWVFGFGIHGVTLGTIASYIFANFMLEPRLIHKYSFNNYRPVREFYFRNFGYMAILTAIAAVDMWICNHLCVGHGLFSLIVHLAITGLSVPLVFWLLYGKQDECQYLVNTVKKTALKLLSKFHR